MDRVVNFPGQIPLETDLLSTNRNAMVGLGILAGALLGTSTVVSGLACSASTPPALTVSIAPGSIYSLQNVDNTPFSSLDADTSHQITKQGIALDATTLACPAPAAAGFSVSYLIQAAYQDIDDNAVVLPYYNSTNPAQAYAGPANSGASQATRRRGAIVLSAKPGIAAATGTQLAPAADAGYVGLWVVTVTNGQATITSSSIAAAPAAPFIASLADYIARLADGSAAARGPGLVGGVGQMLNYAVGTLGWQLKNQAINVLWNGAVGDGTVDDTAALNALGALGLPLYIPYTANGYSVTSSITFSCNVVCDGAFVPTAAVGANPTIILASGGYAAKRRFQGLRVAGGSAATEEGVSGIRNDCENSLMVDCYVNQLAYGFIIRAFSITLDKCRASGCQTNLSAYARSSAQQINTLTIRGGNYDSATVRSVYIGDTTWPDAWAAGNTHGVAITICDSANFDGGEIKIDNVQGVTVDTIYSETSSSGYGIVLGGAADGSVRNVAIRNFFCKSMRIAIKCLTAVDGLRVGRNTFTDVSHCGLYVVSDLYPYTYEAADSTASFEQGVELHTGCRWLAASVLNFGYLTETVQGMYNGVQRLEQPTGVVYPGATIVGTNLVTQRDSSGDNFRRYSSPATAIAGSLNLTGAIFTFANASDAAKFNGQDSITLSTGGARFIRQVDYEAGIAYLDAATSAGAATLSQVSAALRSELLAQAAPTTGTWARGDHAVNSTPAVGSPKGWTCTVAGTPGTWVSDGNL